MGFSTVGGLVMALMNRVPRPGDEAVESGMVFRVISMDRLLVDEVLIAPLGHAVLSELGQEDLA
jgi:CBS domain containing-hemolysin-like protein